MNFQKISKLLVFLILIILLSSCNNKDTNLQFYSKFRKDIKRSWISENFWANRLQDWQLNKGRIECINAEFPLRTVHILPYTLSKDSGQVHIELELGLIQDNDSLEVTDFAGLLIGAGSVDSDFRERAFIYGEDNQDIGTIVAINGKGKIIYLNNEKKDELLNLAAAEEIGSPKLSKEGLLIYIDIIPEGNKYSINTSIIDKESEKIISYAKIINIDKKKIDGNIALIANGGKNKNKSSFWFKDLNIRGNKLKYTEENTIGPIIGTNYYILENKVNLTAQFMPLSKMDNNDVILEISEYKKENWQQIAKTQIDTLSYTAKFRVEMQKSNTIYNYRIIYTEKKARGKSKKIQYYGIISNNKKQQNIIKLALFKNNNFQNPSSLNERFNTTEDKMIFPNPKLTEAISIINPDLFLFMGNQINTNTHELPDFSNFNNLRLDYLNKWYQWYFAFGEFTSITNSLILPSNSDFFISDTIKNKEKELHKKLNKKETESFIKLVYSTQCTNENFDLNEFSSFNFGNISFALLNNKIELTTQKKQNLLTTSTNENIVDSFQMKEFNFLKKWATEWFNSEMKAIITRNPISQMLPQEPNSNYIKKEKNIINFAKKTQSIIISSTNTNSVFYKYGLKNYGDASYAYLAPLLHSSDKLKKEKIEFINSNYEKIQILAKEKNDSLEIENKKSLSFGIISFNKFQKSISFENIVCELDSLKGHDDNWRETILNKNNYQEKSPSYLPLLEIKGLTSLPVISIYDGITKELIYSKRLTKMNIKPQVYYWGKYDIEILNTSTGKIKRIEGVYAKNINDQSSISVKF